MKEKVKFDVTFDGTVVRVTMSPPHGRPEKRGFEADKGMAITQWASVSVLVGGSLLAALVGVPALPEIMITLGTLGFGLLVCAACAGDSKHSLLMIGRFGLQRRIERAKRKLLRKYANKLKWKEGWEAFEEKIQSTEEVEVDWDSRTIERS